MKTVDKLVSKMTDNDLKAEAIRLRLAFKDKGVTHLWDFIQPFHPKNRFDREEFRLCVYGRRADAVMVKVLREVLNKVSV